MLNPHPPPNFLCSTVKVTNMGLETGRQPYTNRMQGLLFYFAFTIVAWWQMLTLASRHAYLTILEILWTPESFQAGNQDPNLMHTALTALC